MENKDIASYITRINLTTEFPDISFIEHLINKEYTNTTLHNYGKPNSAAMGICFHILNSLMNHLTSVVMLLSRCHIESSCCIAASMYEKSLTLHYLLLDMEARSKVYQDHHDYRKTCWSVKEMIIGSVKEMLPDSLKSGNQNSLAVQNHIDHLYLEYSCLCAIKHGNPGTLAALNEMISPVEFFEPTPKISSKDKDILGYVYLSCTKSVFGSLVFYAKYFCNEEHTLKMIALEKDVSNVCQRLKLNVPAIVFANEKNFKPEFLEYLLKCQGSNNKG